MHGSHVDFSKPIFLIVDMHNSKSRIAFTVFWVLKNQYSASTGVALGNGVLKRVVLGGKACPTKQYLQKK